LQGGWLLGEDDLLATNLDSLHGKLLRIEPSPRRRPT
jgi:hypothetical protein